MAEDFFSAYELGPLSLANRMVMAPMTRARAGSDGVVGELVAEYYAQRASFGLIIAEATVVSADAIIVPHCPGIYSEAQLAAWKTVTDKVHGRGGKIYLQLTHPGRIAYPLAVPVSSSSLAASGQILGPGGFEDFPVPRELAAEEIAQIVAAFGRAAKNALAAGFDGVELQGGAGHLVDQFLQSGSNRRQDAYGGSIAKRCRFLLEVVEAMSAECGANRVGVKLSPSARGFGMIDADPEMTFRKAVSGLSSLGIAYVHMTEPSAEDLEERDVLRENTLRFRPYFSGAMIAGGGFDRERAQMILEKGGADLVSFGMAALANPDLPERFRQKKPLNEPDYESIFGEGEKGYTDYPFLERHPYMQLLDEKS